MNSDDKNTSILEYALKDLKQENVQLQDQINKIFKTEIQKREELLNLKSAAL